MITIDELREFEDDIAREFLEGGISSPIHLGGGNEERLISIFKDIRPEDWVLAGWRSHYHCLLKGVQPAELKTRIMAGHSISLCFAKYKVLCSGICGGIAPIAIGLAMSLKRREDEGHIGPKVWCFLGDMSAETGIVHEAMKYGRGHSLPVNWIIEDNGISINTDTQESWGTSKTLRYHYTLLRPHCGIGQWVRF